MSDKGKAEIYAILCPAGEIRYIGKAVDSAKRFAGHMRETRRRTPLYDWIKSLREKDQVPSFEVLSVVDYDGWQAEEKRVIAQFRADGARLLNVADGGDEPHCPMDTRIQNGKNSYSGKHFRVKNAIRVLGKIVRAFNDAGTPERAATAKEAIRKMREASDTQKNRMEELIAASPILSHGSH